jgi:hypothetical protein
MQVMQTNPQSPRFVHGSRSCLASRILMAASAAALLAAALIFEQSSAGAQNTMVPKGLTNFSKTIGKSWQNQLNQ